MKDKNHTITSIDIEKNFLTKFNTIHDIKLYYKAIVMKTILLE